MTTKNKMEIWDTYNFPDYALCLLSYGDVDGLEDEDIKAFNEWQAYETKCIKEAYQYTPISIVFEVGVDVGFCTLPAFGLPTMCTECSISVIIKQ